MAEITQASQAQSHDIEHIQGALGEIDHDTRQNAVLVEQASAAAGSLLEQANNLAQVVSVFKLSADAAGRAHGLHAVPAQAVALLPQAPAARAPRKKTSSSL
jgi:hypothetical protein